MLLDINTTQDDFLIQSLARPRPGQSSTFFTTGHTALLILACDDSAATSESLAFPLHTTRTSKPKIQGTCSQYIEWQLTARSQLTAARSLDMLASRRDACQPHNAHVIAYTAPPTTTYIHLKAWPVPHRIPAQPYHPTHLCLPASHSRTDAQTNKRPVPLSNEEACGL